jgi:hypothetical protein
VRDRQIEEHNRAKNQAEREKRRDGEQLKSLFQTHLDDKANVKAADKEKKERTLAGYKE